jgi:hypothetical protein
MGMDIIDIEATVRNSFAAESPQSLN